ncbi:MAG: nitrous oxide reductase family maturation protein NosD [Hyphomicrobiales bacterium]
MSVRRHMILALSALWLPASADAGETRVPATPGALAAAIELAQPGDVLRLRAGRHDGGVVIDKPLALEGGGRAHVVGTGAGSVVTVTAQDVRITGLRVSGSGSSHETLDSGVKLTKTADRAVVAGNRIIGNLVGVDVHGARDARVADNRIVGRTDRRMNARGNGIYVWNAPGLIVEGNDVRFGRDGIFVNTSKNNVFRNNSFRDLRFAIHYMYTNRSEVTGNRSIGNHIGYALMFSKRLKVHGNLSLGDRDHGIMLNYANDADITGNVVRNGAKKCIFLYNANKNRISGNRFENCRIGVHFTAGSERNTISGNSFVSNRTQVKYVGSKWHDWSAGGQGNFWSDHPAFDLDGNGIADNRYRPNDLVDQILWTQPSAKLLLGSPALQILRWSQSQFPALLPGGVVDNAPLMRGPGIAASQNPEPAR